LLTIQIIVIFATVVAFYAAMNIGGNDVANAMGTSVASKALTYKQAVFVAAVFEFSGAFFVGGHVTETVKRGMVDMSYFQGDPNLIIYGMTAALVGTAIWLRLATHFGWPVSTTHSIVGSVVGFGIVAKGFHVVHWSKIGSIAASWLVSPLAGGVMAFLIFTFLRTYILEAKEPFERIKFAAPFLAAAVIFIIALSLMYKGLKNINLAMSFGSAAMLSAGIALIAAVACAVIVKKAYGGIKDEKTNINYDRVENLFKYLQIMTACYVAFAHGANDVANAIGPLAAVIAVAKTGEVAMQVPVPLWLLAMGGGGIVIGLVVLGGRVMETIGKKITEIVPSRGFSAEFATATTVLFCSKLGLPISTTHTLVGAVIGVGFARGIGALDLRIVRNIISSWFITLPATMAVTIIAYKVIVFLAVV